MKKTTAELALAALKNCADSADVHDAITAIEADLAQAVEPVGRVVSSGPANFHIFQWLSADHSFRVPIGAMLYAAPVNAWMPIESAPKDGSIFLITNGTHVYPAFHNKFNSFWPWGIFDNTDTSLTGCCDLEHSDRISFNSLSGRSPSHWMPLPPAPGSAT